MKSTPVRVRFGPSPTGFLHIGGARTAFFNWLYAKKHGGVFILRIEDTDAARSEKQYEDDILDELRWLGLPWDEFYRQTDRIGIYETYLRELLTKKRAYYCFCTKEEVEAYQESLRVNGHAPTYSGKCRTLDALRARERLDAGEKAVIRFRMPEQKVSFRDLIRGEVTFDTALVGDIVIAKSVREPLYNFAVAVDDHEMTISHVIRGEEHLANTPRQIAMFEAFGFKIPQFAHLPLILNPDRSKMSKRFSATSIQEYRAQGYLPDALANFIALLGWHPKDDHEILGRDELITQFELERVQKGGAVFDVQKLDWLNNQYIRQTPNESLRTMIEALTPLPKSLPEKRLLALIHKTKERLAKLSDFPPQTAFFFALPEYAASLLNWKQTSAITTKENLEAAYATLGTVREQDFTAIKLEEILKPLGATRGRGEVFWPLRVALSGKEASPGPFEIMEILGKAETLKRIERALSTLNKNQNEK